MMTVLDEEELVASAVVYPGSTEEVQTIVLWANKFGIPIFPISMGRNCKPTTLVICFTAPTKHTMRLIWSVEWDTAVPLLGSVAL